MGTRNLPTQLNKPSLFIGSSSEGLDLAAALQAELEQSVEIHRWDQGVFGLSSSYIESLEQVLAKVDFAVLVLTPDDIVKSRSALSPAPRDNVIFELGLLMGSLGRSRCFFVFPEDIRPKIPSDLLGISAASFRSRGDKNLRASVSSAASKIKDTIRNVGRRQSYNLFFTASEKASPGVADIAGLWAGYANEQDESNKKVSDFVIEQSGSFVKAQAKRSSKTGGVRVFEYEGRLVSGQLILIFEEPVGKGFIVGTSVLSLSGNLQVLKGLHSYYSHDDYRVISTPVCYKRA